MCGRKRLFVGEQVFDFAIIGAGQAGVPLARALADAGRSVALFERDRLGGSCVNFGCTPSKTLIASANLAYQIQRCDEYGLRVAALEIDFPGVMRRVRHLAAEGRQDLDRQFGNHANPCLIRETARIEGRDANGFRVRSAQGLIRAAHVVLDTGTRTRMPPIPGLNDGPLITAENWTELVERPERLLILGGGVVAMEMAQAFRRLGSHVTILQNGASVLQHEDADVSQTLEGLLRQEGVDIRLGVEAKQVTHHQGRVTVGTDTGPVSGTHLFVAAGRQPNTDQLGLETLGYQPDDRGFVQVDDCLRSPVTHLSAAGDITGARAVTPTAYDDFRVLRSRFLGAGRDTRCRIIPYAVFTDPELGRVGLTEAQARKDGKHIRVGRYTMTQSGRARESGKTNGFIKVLLDARTDQILGVAALCEGGADVVQLFVELMNANTPAQTMLDSIHIHPTIAEAAKNAVAAAKSDG